MYDVVLLTLGAAQSPADPCGTGATSGNVGSGCGLAGGCGSGEGRSAGCAAAAESAGATTDSAGATGTVGTGATGAAGTAGAAGCGDSPRVPVLACAAALTSAGGRAEPVTARSDAEIDDILARFDGPPRADGLTWPDPDGKTKLVVAVATDAQLRAVVRRLVRRYAPPPSRRPADLAANRTVPDLPPIGILPLRPVTPLAAPPAEGSDLIDQLGLPATADTVAGAVLANHVRRLDLLRNDGGSVTLNGVLIGGADDSGRPLPWRGRVEVDDVVLSAGDEPVLAAAVGNAGGYATLDGVPLLTAPDATDALVEVAVAVPAVTRSRWGRSRVRLEIRRARGRAVAVTPRDGAVPFLDDGVAGELTRKRSWWVEPSAWAVYAQPVER